MQNTLNLTRTQWVEINSEEALFLFFGVFVFMRFIWDILNYLLFYQLFIDARPYENA